MLYPPYGIPCLPVNNHPKKGLQSLTELTDPPASPELAMARRVLRESKFSHDTQEIAYLAPLGRAITLRGIGYGKHSQRKKECILFSLKTFSHKTVSNHSVITLPRGLCGLLKALSDAEGERP
jgi:hypothetical protein